VGGFPTVFDKDRRHIRSATWPHRKDNHTLIEQPGLSSLRERMGFVDKKGMRNGAGGEGH
jgi:hypothetical protein